MSDLELLALAVHTGDLPQRAVAMGGPTLTEACFPATLLRGPVKLLLADHALPSLEELAAWVAAAHATGRRFAAHCVTRASLVLLLSALAVAGPARGDRIEHGAVVPPDLAEQVAVRGLTVVTQPNFVLERGDDYLRDVDPDDRPHLYRCRSLIDAGIPVAGSTDAPFGHPDPWRAVSAAVDRRTAGGRTVNREERLPPGEAIRLFLGHPDDPGGESRRVSPGARADLCLFDEPLAAVSAEPAAERVRATVIAGRVVHSV